MYWLRLSLHFTPINQKKDYFSDLVHGSSHLCLSNLQDRGAQLNHKEQKYFKGLIAYAKQAAAAATVSYVCCVVGRSSV